MAVSTGDLNDSALWHAAFEQLRTEEEERDVLAKFKKTLRTRLVSNGQSMGDLDTEDGHRRLLAFLEQKDAELNALKGTESLVAQNCDVMSQARELVHMSPLAAIAVAGLFLAFDLYHTGKSESNEAFRIASEAANTVVRAGYESDGVRPREGDTEDLVNLRRSLEQRYVVLYKTVLGTIGRLVNALHSQRKRTFWRNTVVEYDWAVVSATLQHAEQARNQVWGAINRPAQPVDVEDVDEGTVLHDGEGYKDGKAEAIRHARADSKVMGAAGWTGLDLAA